MHHRRTALAALGLTLLLAAIVWPAVTNHLLPNSAEGVLHAQAAPTPRVPATPNDLILPGTQPGELVDPITAPQQCSLCHANYAEQTDQPHDTETWYAWQGSMMAQSGRDPLFYAALDIANSDVEGGGEYCLRCHLPSGWLEGRSSTTDGSAMTSVDQEGVSCAVCHRMVDPVYSAENPARDANILAALEYPVDTIGTARMVIDPEDYRRGPFDIIADWNGVDPHQQIGAEETQVSPYHQESAFCGTCHDIDNPLFSWDEASQSYQPNETDEPAEDSAELFAVERTYSEWELSAFNSETGVYLPQFGGNDHWVASCQDCHMQTITGAGATLWGNTLIRDDMPVHNLTGANTWVPGLIPQVDEFAELFRQEPERLEALESGVDRARAMLQNAAALSVVRDGNTLAVTVTNQSGHKLPSGYIEGRRMWIEVRGYDADGELVYSSGLYDPVSAEIEGYHADPTLKVYEAQQGLTPDWAAQVGLEPGHSFHFMLNNTTLFDNRIPPMGYSFEAFNAVQAAPVTNGQPDPNRYADGQFWDTTLYTLPDGVVRGEVRLLHQIASKEYIEFLRDENPNPDGNRGDIMYELWEENGKSPPEVMASQTFSEQTWQTFMPSITRQ